MVPEYLVIERDESRWPYSVVYQYGPDKWDRKTAQVFKTLWGARWWIRLKGKRWVKHHGKNAFTESIVERHLL